MSEFEDANVDKDILSQIFGDDIADDKDDEKKDDSLFADSSAGDNEDEETAEAVSETEEEVSAEDILKDATEEEEPEPVEEELSVEEVLETARAQKPVEETKAPVKTAQIDVDDDDVTVITKGTTINGGISSEGSLEVMGTITGDVDCLGRVDRKSVV